MITKRSQDLLLWIPSLFLFLFGLLFLSHEVNSKGGNPLGLFSIGMSSRGEVSRDKVTSASVQDIHLLVKNTKNWSNAELKKLCKISAYDARGGEETGGESNTPGGGNTPGGANTPGGGSEGGGSGNTQEGGGTSQGTGGTDSGDSGHVNL